MDHRVESLQYGLHSTLWVLGIDVHTPGVILTEVYTASHYPRMNVVVSSIEAWSSFSRCYLNPLQTRLNRTSRQILAPAAGTTATQ